MASAIASMNGAATTSATEVTARSSVRFSRRWRREKRWRRRENSAMPSIGSRMTLAAPRLASPGETRTLTFAPERRIDRLQRGAAGGAPRDDHRLHAWLGADLARCPRRSRTPGSPSIIDEAGLVDLDESAHAISHPWAALQSPRQRSRLVIGAGDERHLARDRMRVERVTEPTRISRPALMVTRRQNEQHGDEVARRFDLRDEDEQHHQSTEIATALKRRCNSAVACVAGAGRRGRRSRTPPAIPRS